jgi:hypothetical protein
MAANERECSDTDATGHLLAKAATFLLHALEMKRSVKEMPESFKMAVHMECHGIKAKGR